ncbi:MAG TPA: IS110 family transposase [Terriglobales bacterium]|nr:IS110 family transposase [Terriglobales bacterium]
MVSKPVSGHKLDRSGALSHCRCDALDGAAARVADSEHSRHARLQEKRLALEPPPAGRTARAEQVAAGQDVSLGIHLVKTDRRDAEKLARSHRSDDLTAVWVPDEGSEALRDLVRAREAAKQDQLRARHRLSKFLLRTGRRPAMGLKAWTERYLAWVQQIQFSQPAQEFTLLDYLHEVQHMDERVQRLEQAIAEAVKLASPQVQEVIRGLQALRGVAHLSAVTIAAELGNISRFESARKLMGYSGAVPSEDSSGKRQRRGNITKTGNAHLRRIAVESAWSYRFRPAIGPRLRQRQEGVPEEIKEIAWKAQIRLHKRYLKLMAAGKDKQKIITAVGRELLGFVWAIGIKAETAGKLQMAA